MIIRFIFAGTAFGFLGLAAVSGLADGIVGVIILTPPGLLLGFLASRPVR